MIYLVLYMDEGSDEPIIHKAFLNESKANKCANEVLGWVCELKIEDKYGSKKKASKRGLIKDLQFPQNFLDIEYEDPVG